MAVDYITAGRSLVLDEPQSQYYIYVRQLPPTDIRNNLILPGTSHTFVPVSIEYVIHSEVTPLIR